MIAGVPNNYSYKFNIVHMLKRRSPLRIDGSRETKDSFKICYNCPKKNFFLKKKLLYLSKPVLQMKKNFYTCPKKLFLKMIIPFIHPEENLTFSN